MPLVACGGPPISPLPAVTSAAPAATTSDAVDAPLNAPPCGPVPGGPAEASSGPWWRDRIFYELFVRSFADSDGDGIGDLRGVTERLDYLNDGDPATTNDLGVTGLWLMPIAESPSYHGYDVTDYRSVEADYGTPADFQALMLAAHERGIDIIVDLVINHTSIDHPWFQDARKPGSTHDDWYVWTTDGVPFAGPGGRRVWHADGDRRYYAYFWEGMPDLNVTNPDVTAELDGIARFWLDDMGADGFRLDAARHLIEDGSKLENSGATLEWLADFRTRLKRDGRDPLVLGEVWDATSMSSSYVRDGSLDLTFDFGLAGSTIAAIRSGDAGSLRAAQQEVADSYPPDGLATFLTNHDQDRIAGELGSNLAAEKLAAALLLTGPGIPFIYYGEEIGMTGHKPDERIRTPMRWDATEPAAGFSTAAPWQTLSDDAAAVNVAGESADPASLLSTYRALVSLRGAHPALAHGTWTSVDPSNDGVIASLRQADSETVLVVANLSDEAIEEPALSLAAGSLCGSPAANMLFGPIDVRAPTVTPAGGFDGYVPLDRIGARETIVIELTP